MCQCIKIRNAVVCLRLPRTRSPNATAISLTPHLRLVLLANSLYRLPVGCVNYKMNHDDFLFNFSLTLINLHRLQFRDKQKSRTLIWNESFWTTNALSCRSYWCWWEKYTDVMILYRNDNKQNLIVVKSINSQNNTKHINNIQQHTNTFHSFYLFLWLWKLCNFMTFATSVYMSFC